jgi:hypothetical protein
MPTSHSINATIAGALMHLPGGRSPAGGFFPSTSAVFALLVRNSFEAVFWGEPTVMKALSVFRQCRTRGTRVFSCAHKMKHLSTI